MADTPSIDMITADLDRLGQHIKEFNKGAYPAFLFQLHSVLKIHDILEMRLSDVYYCDDGCVRLLPEIVFEGEKVHLDQQMRTELAWYALQRVAVCNADEEALEDWLCVNIHGRQLQPQAYRKMLERTSFELGFRSNYSVGYLHSLYGYLRIASGQKTIAEVAREYGVTQYYLQHRIFKGTPIQYEDHIIRQVANIEEDKEKE